MKLNKISSILWATLVSELLFASSPAFAKSLTVYFSRADENYSVGVVDEGNTARLAKIIAKKTGSEIAQIVPEKAYPKDYKAATEVASAEKEANARPALKVNPDVSGYDEIYLGTPVWWGDMPMAVYTFLESHDFKGKTIHPFVTHEGSGLSAIDRKIAEATGANVGEALVMRGSIAQKSDSQTESHVDEWLK